MLVLGIDPGYERLGVAILNHISTGSSLVYSDCIETSSKLPHPLRLVEIGKRVAELVGKFQPDSAALESLFFNTNQKTALRVAEARGVGVYELAKQNIPTFEYTPLQIKIAVTSYGRSDKRQVTAMVQKLVKINKKIKHDDEYDAIAVALTHAVSAKHLSTT